MAVRSDIGSTTLVRARKLNGSVGAFHGRRCDLVPKFDLHLGIAFCFSEGILDLGDGFRQFSNIRRDPSRLILRQQLGRCSALRLTTTL
jgi:hypothetical protein